MRPDMRAKIATGPCQAAMSVLEAGVLSSATADVLEYTGGRERPDATTSSNQWRKGGDSFPTALELLQPDLCRIDAKSRHEPRCNSTDSRMQDFSASLPLAIVLIKTV
jgi:hypothetical protein